MPTASSWPERLSSEKSGRCGIAAKIKERGALPMIDRGDIRQATDRCSNIWPHCRALVMVSVWSIRPCFDCKIQRSGRNVVREIDVASRVTAIISALLSASSFACHGLLIITVITPLPTKPSATKMPEN